MSGQDIYSLSTDRKQLPYETDFEWKERIKRIDAQEALMKRFHELCVPMKKEPSK